MEREVKSDIMSMLWSEEDLKYDWIERYQTERTRVKKYYDVNIPKLSSQFHIETQGWIQDFKDGEAVLPLCKHFRVTC